MKDEGKVKKYPAVKVAVDKYGAIPIDSKSGFVYVRGHRIDLTASGTEDWQVALNIINQMN